MLVMAQSFIARGISNSSASGPFFSLTTDWASFSFIASFLFPQNPHFLLPRPVPPLSSDRLLGLVSTDLGLESSWLTPIETRAKLFGSGDSRFDLHGKFNSCFGLDYFYDQLVDCNRKSI